MYRCALTTTLPPNWYGNMTIVPDITTPDDDALRNLNLEISPLLDFVPSAAVVDLDSNEA